MGIAMIVFQLILSLSILVVLHEMGHFFPAKFFKTRVEKFYLFFNPWFSLFKKKVGETEYGVGWLPLGGYVKIAGMIDESMDTEQMEQEEQPWEFRAKPAWQRLIIMLGGVTVNFILGFLLFGMVLFIWGEQYVKSEDATYGIAVSELGEQLGLRDGDVVLKVGDIPVDKADDGTAVKEIVLHQAGSITVEREGKVEELPVPAEMSEVLASNENASKGLYDLRFPAVLDRVVKGSPAEAAGLKIGDKITGINGQDARFYDKFLESVPGPGEEFALSLERDGQQMQKTLQTDEEGLIGIDVKDPKSFFNVTSKKYSLAEAIPGGFVKGYRFLADQFTAFGKMFSGEINPNKTLGGFGSIAKLFPSTWNWQQFWTITAVLSLILAFMNLLPIPALDGGHVMFLLWEIITGKKPGDKFMEYATTVGFVILIALLLYANGLDVLRAFK